MSMPGAMATILQPRKNCGQAEGMAQQRRGTEPRYLRLTWGHVSVKQPILEPPYFGADLLCEVGLCINGLLLAARDTYSLK